MEWLFKVALTVLSVGLVLAIAERRGRSVAGLVAGMPLTTGPALLWIAREQGPHFAADAAVVTVTACALLASLALIYAHAVIRSAPAASLASAAAVAAALVAVPALVFGCSLPAAAALAVVCCGLALALWPNAARGSWPDSPAESAPPRPRRRRSMAITAASAGGFGVLVAFLGPLGGIVTTGLLSSLPVVSLSVAAAEHAAGGPAAVLRFLHGYVAGLFARIGFGVVFALALGALGPAWALALASLAAGAINLGSARRLAGREVRSRVRRAACPDAAGGGRAAGATSGARPGSPLPPMPGPATAPYTG